MLKSKLSRIFARSPEPFCVFDLEGAVQEANTAFAKALGSPHLELAETPLWDLVVADDAERARAAVAAWGGGEPVDRLALRLRQVDGGEAVVAFDFFAEVEDRVVYAIGRREGEPGTDSEATLEQLRQQAALLDETQDAIWVEDLDSRITFWNRAAEQLYGWSAEEALGRPRQEVFQVVDPQILQARRAAAAEGKWSGRLAQETKGGRPLTVDSRWTLTRDVQGEPRSILVANTDLTEKLDLENRVLRAQRMESIGMLAGGIAHDLNNVLGPIFMAVDILKDHVQDERSELLLETLKDSVSRGSQLIKQVLTFAQGAAGGRVVMAPHNLVRELAEMLSQTVDKSITVERRYSKELWFIRADATQAYQILLNLAINGRDAMPGGGTLTLTAENVTIDETFAAMKDAAEAGKYVCFTVSDTGTGIPEELHEKIFEPFFTTKGEDEGTGLGLATVRKILAENGGFLELRTEVGTGTTFRVYLPAEESEPGLDLDVPTGELPLGQGEHLLMVEDEASVRDLAKQALEAFGYKVTTAGDGSEAVARFASAAGEIDLVLVDMNMPVMDGPSTIRALATLDPEVDVIAISGSVEKERTARAIGGSVRAFLNKPFTTASLLQTIADVLARTRKEGGEGGGQGESKPADADPAGES